MEKIIVRVPATSANCGPGFDCLGLALDLFNIFSFEPDKTADSYSYTFNGIGSERLMQEDPADDLIGHAMEAVYRVAGEKPVYGHITSDTRIPPSRGLGSSSTAIVGGLLMANETLAHPYDRDELLQLATKIEGHPDNVAPALLGNLVCAVMEDDHVFHNTVDIPDSLHFAVSIPDVEVSTEFARSVLPDTISRQEAVTNVGHACLFLTALAEQKWDQLRLAMIDYLHVPYRRSLIPHCEDVFRTATDHGAYGVTISGSGSTIIAYCADSVVNDVAEAMKAVYDRNQIKSLSLSLTAAHNGAEVL